MWFKLITRGYSVDVIPEILYYYRHLPTSYGKIKRAIDVERFIIQNIQELIAKRPEMFIASYPYLHQLIRELVRIASEGTRTRELGVAETSALYALNLKLAGFSARHKNVRRLLEFSGRILRRAIS